MDHVEQNSKADELTRNRFVERAVEAYQASSQNTVEDVQANNQNDQRDHSQVASIQTGNNSQQSAHGGHSNPILTELQATLRNRNIVTQRITGESQAVEHHQALNLSDHSVRDQQSNNIRPELQLAFNSQAQRELRERIQVIRQVPSNETRAQQSTSAEPNEHESRVYTRPPRPEKPPKPESIGMRSALEKFRRMEIQNESNNRLTRSENNSLPRPSPIPPPVPPRVFETLQRPQNSEEEESLNVDTSDPLNESLMVDIDDAESISHLIELGFDESNATLAFFATDRNLEEAIVLLLDQNASN